MGDGTTTNRPSPVTVMGLTNVSEISAGPDSNLGGGHTCVRRNDGGIWCWGKNDRGQIGDGTTENRTVPVMVLSGAIHVAVGGDHSCAVTSDGGVRCWGYNVRSQLGEGTTMDRTTPFATSAP
jgi:alpha-tubulin suppressor-like RCC1 family protein